MTKRIQTEYKYGCGLEKVQKLSPVDVGLGQYMISRHMAQVCILSASATDISNRCHIVCKEFEYLQTAYSKLDEAARAVLGSRLRLRFEGLSKLDPDSTGTHTPSRRS